eukprot:1172691-Rhodomonas_salina.1
MPGMPHVYRCALPDSRGSDATGHPGCPGGETLRRRGRDPVRIAYDLIRLIEPILAAAEATLLIWRPAHHP